MASATAARVLIRKITGASSLGRHRLTSLQHCPQCGIPSCTEGSLERHVVRYPNGDMRHFLHSGLVKVLGSILRDASVPELMVVVEARGLRAAYRSISGDVVPPYFFADGRHMVIDAVMTSVYRITVLSRVVTILGYATKPAEYRKFLAGRTVRHPIAAPHNGPHVLVTFAIEEEGRLGARAQALLMALATTALAKGKTREPQNPPTHDGIPMGPMLTTTHLHLAPPSVF
jgi:hypothetical protein